MAPPTPSLSFALGMRCIAWALAILALRWAFGHPELIGQLAWLGVTWIVGSRVIDLVVSIVRIAAIIKVITWIVGVFKPDIAKRLDPLGNILPIVLRSLAQGIIVIAKAVYTLVEGKAPAKSAKRSKGGISS